LIFGLKETAINRLENWSLPDEGRREVAEKHI